MSIQFDDRITTDEELQQLIDKMVPVFKQYGIEKAIVFGSFARGEASRRSDIDLILVQQTDKRFLDRYDGILDDLNRIASHRAVEAFIYTPEELAAISHRRFVASALHEGKVIYECK